MADQKHHSWHARVTETPEPAYFADMEERKIRHAAATEVVAASIHSADNTSDMKQPAVAVASIHSSENRLKPHQNFFAGWIIEMVSVIAAAASLSGIVALLLTFDHEVMARLPFKLELGTILSILAKVTEATVGLVVAAGLSQIMWIRYRSRPRPLNDFAVYDAATRGAMGQARFFLERGHNLKAYAGVCLALLALALGPSYQQAVKYEIINDSALLASCFKTNHSTTADTMYNALHLSLYDNFNNVGTKNDQYLQRLNSDCATGTCDWPGFASLGICGQCVDASDSVITNCSVRPDVLNGSLYGCVSSLNNNNFVNNYTDPTYGRVLASMAPNVNGSALGRQLGNAVSHDFSSLRYSKGDVLHATNCALYYCVRGYEANVTKSFLAENITTTWTDPNAPRPLGDVITAFASTNTIGPERDIVLSPPQSQWERMNLTKPTNFTMDWYTHKMLQGIFAAAFNGSWLLRYTNGTKASQYGVRTGDDFLVMQIYLNLWGSDATQQNMSTVVSSLAYEMTSAMRGTCNSTDFVQGAENNVRTVLHVIWLWLIFPGVIICLTGCFLLAVMLESRRRGSLTWKTGILPLLFHSLNSESKSDGAAHGPAECAHRADLMANELDEVDGMKKRARLVRVQMARNDSGGWHWAQQ